MFDFVPLGVSVTGSRRDGHSNRFTTGGGPHRSDCVPMTSRGQTRQGESRNNPGNSPSTPTPTEVVGVAERERRRDGCTETAHRDARQEPVQEWQRRLGLDSRNSGRPPPRAAPEGQPQRLQVYGLPAPQPEVTAHRAGGCRCRQFGQLTRAAFPEGVTAPVPYGSRPRRSACSISARSSSAGGAAGELPRGEASGGDGLPSGGAGAVVAGRNRTPCVRNIHSGWRPTV